MTIELKTVISEEVTGVDYRFFTLNHVYPP